MSSVIHVGETAARLSIVLPAGAIHALDPKVQNFQIIVDSPELPLPIDGRFSKRALQQIVEYRDRGRVALRGWLANEGGEVVLRGAHFVPLDGSSP